MTDRKIKIQKSVRDKILRLPAFKLSQFNKNTLTDISLILFKPKKYEMYDQNNIIEENEEDYFSFFRELSLFRQICLSLNLWHFKTKKRSKLIWLLSVILAFSIKTLIALKVKVLAFLALIFFMLFLSSYISFMESIQRCYMETTFLIAGIKKIDGQIGEYVDDAYVWADKTSQPFPLTLDELGTKISKEFVKIEIDRISANQKTINLPAIIYGFSASFIIIELTGNWSIDIVKNFFEAIGILEQFKAIQNLSLQEVYLFYSTLGAAYFRDIAIRISERRTRKLKMSLSMLEMMYVDKK